MQCKIEWNALALADWESRFAQVRRATLLQSYDYARAACPLYRQKARWGLIRMGGEEAGLVQILEAGILGNALHALMLDRGPLWFDGYGNEAHSEAFFRAFAAAFPARPGRRRRVIPEIPEEQAALVERCGFRRLDRPGYRTIWLDLTLPEEALRAGLDKKWRNALTKAERGPLAVEWDTGGKTLPWLLTNYQSDKVKKGYDGPSAKLIHALAGTFAPKGGFLIGRALLDNQAVAAILVLCHGGAATYQIGWSADEGRKHAAHNLLLWQAVCRLKETGIRDFDLGGVSDEGHGLAKFKEGLGGQSVIYAGHYV